MDESCVEDWIRVTLADDDDDGETLLSNFHDNCHESYVELLDRIEQFIQEEIVPNRRIVTALQNHIIRDVLVLGVAKIITTWTVSPGQPVTIEAQTSRFELTDMLELKMMFLVTVYVVMLKSEEWKEFHTLIYTAINNILLEVITVIEKYPHHPNDQVKTTFHLTVKAYISTLCCTLWEKILNLESDEILTQIPVDLIVPTMRRLGMLDVLDSDWNMFGAWDGICLELQKNARTDLRFNFNTNADKILLEKSMIWWKSRKSLRCRQWIHMGHYGSELPPQAFHYFSKCSVTACSNIETKEKPHSIRCKTCWYYHFCSKSCESYAVMQRTHYCNVTPPDKVLITKNETESFLGLQQKKDDDDDHRLGLEICNFCASKKVNLPKCVLQSCSRCQKVVYCSRRCQKWDWPEHKQMCNKA